MRSHAGRDLWQSEREQEVAQMQSGVKRWLGLEQEWSSWKVQKRLFGGDQEASGLHAVEAEPIAIQGFQAELELDR